MLFFTQFLLACLLGVALACFEMGNILLGTVLFVLFIIGQIKHHKKAKERKAAKAYEDTSGKAGIGDFLKSIVLLVFLWPVYLIRYLVKEGRGDYGETGAQKYLRESKEYYDKDLERHRARKAEKERLLDRAATLERQAKYQSGYKYKETMKEVQDLRRQAGRL